MPDSEYINMLSAPTLSPAQFPRGPATPQVANASDSF